MAIETINNQSGLNMGNTIGGGNFSTKNVIEDFMKTEYQEGLRNEFNTMDALINKLPKDTITGKVKYKSFALGIGDNVRAVGSGNYDRYQLGFDDFYGRGVDTVEAQFDTTKLMATFAITDEAILKGTGDGSLIDVLKDTLSRMEIGLKHTYNRYIYGGHDGIIGKLTTGEKITKINLSNATKDANEKRLDADVRGRWANYFYGNAPTMVEFSFTNSHSLIEGMGCLVQIGKTKRLAGYIFQKDNSQVHSEKVIMVIEKTYTSTDGNSWTLDSDVTFEEITASDESPVTVYSRQLNDGSAIAAEYHGLEDIVMRSNNEDDNAILFGVDRRVYRALRSTIVDGTGKYINEEMLRDLSDHLATTSPEGTAISLVCANHRIISQIEKQMYQFKNYNMTTTANLQLGQSGDIKFDNFVLCKDKYARDNNMYMLDQQKIGELVRRDFTWITSGEVNGVLQRRPGTEMYEGIMNKYADMYIDAWRCHAAIKNLSVVAPGTFFSYNADGTPKQL
jgi:hypothetical protein